MKIDGQEVSDYEFGFESNGKATDYLVSFQFHYKADGESWEVVIPEGNVTGFRIDGGNEIIPTDAMLAALRRKVSDDAEIIEAIEELEADLRG